MSTVSFPYGKTHISYDFGAEPRAVLTSSVDTFEPDADEAALIARAMANPVGSPTLADLACGKRRITLIASDHTRPVPSKLIVPAMLAEIRSSSPDAEVTILVATGCHRGTTRAELVSKFCEDIVREENIIVHDCDDSAHLRDIGTLPSGGRCEINTHALDCDLLVAEGFIEPHFFAGFSGGRKSVLPGVASRATVLANHCSEFIAHPNARTGVLEDNPIHRDMLWAAKKAPLAYIVNVVLNADKKVIFAVAGDVEQAHLSGVDFLRRHCLADAVEADIVVTSNGGYPLDQNAYQAVKGMTAAEACVRDGGVIVMLAECADGVGGAHFLDQLSSDADISRTMATFLSRSRGETVPDQWQTQIMLRVLEKASVVFVSSLDAATVEAMHMIPASTLDEAMTIARRLTSENASVTAIPDGVSVMVR